MSGAGERHERCALADRLGSHRVVTGGSAIPPAPSCGSGYPQRHFVYGPQSKGDLRSYGTALKTDRADRDRAPL